MIRASLTLLLPLLFASLVSAAQTTVTLDVRGMTCAACPITVKKSLTKVAGVSRADISYEKRQAVVTFDDVQTTPAKLTRATTDAGFPSTVKEIR
jgi:periplasmic mercuric ion binding protein